MNQFSNTSYDEALKNLDYIRMLNKSVSKYRKYIDRDELEQIKRIALFQAMKDYDNTKNTKFLTYLYWTAKFMVLNHLTQEFRHSHMIYDINFDQMQHKNKDKSIDHLLEGITKQEQEFIYDRYVNNMTYKELGKHHNMSSEGARKKEINIRKKLKCLLS